MKRAAAVAVAAVVLYLYAKTEVYRSRFERLSEITRQAINLNHEAEVQLKVARRLVIEANRDFVGFGVWAQDRIPAIYTEESSRV